MRGLGSPRRGMIRRMAYHGVSQNSRFRGVMVDGIFRRTLGGRLTLRQPLGRFQGTVVVVMGEGGITKKLGVHQRSDHG